MGGGRCCWAASSSSAPPPRPARSRHRRWRLIAARAILGAAGAAMIVMALSVITVLFDEDERPRAIGVWGAANFLALPLGPIVGGWMLANAWWGWVFLVNVPVVIARLRPRRARRPGVTGRDASRDRLAGDRGLQPRAHPADVRRHRGRPARLGRRRRAGAAAGRRGLRRGLRRLGGPARPGRPASRSSTCACSASGASPAGVLLAGLAIFGLFGLLFTMPQYWQAVAGLDAQEAGLRLLPLILGMILGAIPADRVASRIGPATAVAIGLGLMALGLGAGLARGGVRRRRRSRRGASRPGSAQGSACPPPRPRRWSSSTPITAAWGRRSCRRPSSSARRSAPRSSGRSSPPRTSTRCR